MTADVAQKRSFDDSLDALAHVQRRALLLALLADSPQDASTPPETARSGSAGDEVDLLVTIHHVHLPKLEEYGFVEWDRDTDELRRGPNFEEIAPLLELLDDHRDELPDGWL